MKFYNEVDKHAKLHVLYCNDCNDTAPVSYDYATMLGASERLRKLYEEVHAITGKLAVKDVTACRPLSPFTQDSKVVELTIKIHEEMQSIIKHYQDQDELLRRIFHLVNCAQLEPDEVAAELRFYASPCGYMTKESYSYDTQREYASGWKGFHFEPQCKVDRSVEPQLPRPVKLKPVKRRTV
jgi:hypothetical protein